MTKARTSRPNQDAILAGPERPQKVTPEAAAAARLGPEWRKVGTTPAPFTHAFENACGETCLVLVPKLGHGMLRARGAFGAIARIVLDATSAGRRVLLCTPERRNYAGPLKEWLEGAGAPLDRIAFATHPPSFGHPGWTPRRHVTHAADRRKAIAAVLSAEDAEAEAKSQGARLGVRSTTVAGWVARQVATRPPQNRIRPHAPGDLT